MKTTSVLVKKDESFPGKKMFVWCRFCQGIVVHFWCICEGTRNPLPGGRKDAVPDYCNAVVLCLMSAFSDILLQSWTKLLHACLNSILAFYINKTCIIPHLPTHSPDTFCFAGMKLPGK